MMHQPKNKLWTLQLVRPPFLGRKIRLPRADYPVQWNPQSSLVMVQDLLVTKINILMMLLKAMIKVKLVVMTRIKMTISIVQFLQGLMLRLKLIARRGMKEPRLEEDTHLTRSLVMLEQKCQ